MRAMQIKTMLRKGTWDLKDDELQRGARESSSTGWGSLRVALDVHMETTRRLIKRKLR